MRRLSVVLAIALLSTAGLALLFAGPTSATSHTWTSDTDFAGGTATDTEVVGTGAAAAIQLKINPQFNWLNMSPTVSPLPRTGASMAFDSLHGLVLMFGGLSSASVYLNDTWTYNTVTNSWTNVTGVVGPQVRLGAGFSYDPVAQAAFLYGGSDAGPTGRTDLWKYDVVAGTWPPLNPIPSPRAMDSTPMVYDSSVQKHILAGKDSTNTSFLVWLYDSSANKWSGRLPATNPGARSGHTLDFDRRTLRSFLFGGAEGLTVFGDWWDYNATTNTWALLGIPVPNVTPNPRTDHAMVFGPNTAVHLMFGGVDSSSSYPPETWYYVSAGNNWINPPVGSAPGGRRAHSFVWDSAADKTVMFGGRLANNAVTNQTWVWSTGYYNSGTYESATFDAGCAAPNWTDLWWNATTPSTTTVRFKLATSTSPAGPWTTFLGFDGLPGTFYTAPGTAVFAGHDGQQYFRWRAYLATGDVRQTPALNDVGVNYVCPVAPPTITATSPASGATGVAQTADIVVTFSEPMNRSTVTFSFSDAAITFSSSWGAPSTVLTLSHTTPFRECTSFTAQITGGRDQNDNLALVPGAVPNPWSFTTVCVNPFIQSTGPPDGGVNVAQGANLVVSFG